MTLPNMLGASILLPVLAALLCLIKVPRLRTVVVILTGIALSVVSVLFLNKGSFVYTPESILGIPADALIACLDFALLFYILWISFRFKSRLLIVLSFLQIIPLAYLEFFQNPEANVGPALYADQLSIIMCVIISVIGSLICIYGLRYMDEHEHHRGIENSRQGRFFFFMVIFLGAMNGLVFANNILWLYFFWEVTTLCSFMLIKHDETDEAIHNAKRALWMNMLGGVAFVFAMVLMRFKGMPLSLQEVLALNPKAGIFLLPIALLCFAGFTKAAQVPFQSWLCGAMVAPTPVSALLHSSTMVKAGVYIVLRFSPVFQDSIFGTYVALFGAFTFIATAVLALSQSNAKKILAYSTIGNLGLIIACAGIGTPGAMTAAIFLIVFHAISKALMFLCVGTIEQSIGSRDIEDMRGLITRMPKTTWAAIIGMTTLFLPPFGALLSKWMAVEAASSQPLVVLMLALGSALTVVFWGRWLGMLLTSTEAGVKAEVKPEEQSMLIRFPLNFLAAAAVIVSLSAPALHSRLIAPLLAQYYESGLYLAGKGIFSNSIGLFSLYPLFAVFAVGALLAWRASCSKTVRQPGSYSPPYVCGLQDSGDSSRLGFNGPLGQWADFKFSNYYLDSLIGENKITMWINIVAIGILFVSLAGVLQ